MSRPVCRWCFSGWIPYLETIGTRPDGTTLVRVVAWTCRCGTVRREPGAPLDTRAAGEGG